MTFADDNRHQSTPKRTLLEIDLTDTYNKRAVVYQTAPTSFPTATLYIVDAGDGSKGPMLFASTNCYPLLVSHKVRGMTSGFAGAASDADASFVLANGKYPWQQRLEAGAEGRETSEIEVKLGQLLNQYRWAGAVVRLYSVTLPHAGTTQSRQLLFTGIVDAVEGVNEESFTLQCVFDKTYNKTFPDADTPSGGSGSSLITLKDYPNAPPSAINKTIPMVWAGDPSSPYGSVSSVSLNYISPNLLYGLSPMAMTSAKYDSGDSTAATVFSAKFPAAQASAYTPSTYMYVPEANALGRIVPASNVVDTRENYAKISSSPSVVMPLNPTLFGKTYGTVTNPERAFDGKTTTKATLTNAGAHLLCIVPDMSAVGRITELKAFVYLSPGTGVNTGAGAASVNGSIGIYDDTGSAYRYSCTVNLTKSDLDTGGLVTSTTMTTAGIESSEISKWQWWYPGAPRNQLYASVYVGTAAATAYVMAFGFEVTFIPYNITRDVHQKTWQNKYDVQGKLVGKVYS